jgi:hypothetical protein
VNKISAEDVDLSAIDPALRATVRARLRAIAEFENSPGRKKAEELAKGIGLRTSGFYNLVKAWQTLRDPVGLSGRARPRTKSTSIDAPFSSVLDETLASHPDLPANDLISIASTKAALAGITIPNRNKIKRYLTQNRSRILPPSITGQGDLVVEHTVISVPVQSRDHDFPMRPLATIVLDTKQNAVCALDLSHGQPTAAKISLALASVLPAARRSAARYPGGGGIRIALPLIQDEELPQLVDELERQGHDAQCYNVGAYEHGRGIEALYGQIIQGLRFAPRLVTAASARRVMKLKPGQAAMNLAEAEALVCARLGVGDSANS